MNTIIKFMFGDFAIWLPRIIAWLGWAVASYFYLFCKQKNKLLVFLAYFLAISRLAYAAFLTYGQRFVWSQSEFTRFFLTTDGGKYFTGYVWLHFWMSAVISIGTALLFWLFLRALKKYRERFFYEGETELGLVLALICGWPNIIFLIVFTFLSVILVSVYKIIFTTEKYTTLGIPMILACPLVIISADTLIKILGMTALKVTNYAPGVWF